MPKLLDPATAKKIRDDLAHANRRDPAVTFIDRIDALERAVESILRVLEEGR